MFLKFSKKSLSEWYEKKWPETLLRLNWFASARELSKQRGQHRKFFLTHHPQKGCRPFSRCAFSLHPPKVWYSERGCFLLLKRLQLLNRREIKQSPAFSKELQAGTYLPIFDQFRLKTRVNQLKMFTLICSFILSRKRRKTFCKIGIIRC